MALITKHEDLLASAPHYKDDGSLDFSKCVFRDIQDDDEVTMELTHRHGICAPEGYSLVSCDYSSQELYIAYYLSRDPVFGASFFADEWIAEDNTTNPTNSELYKYKNPARDLHTITASSCCYPQLFVGKPTWQHVKIAKTEGLIPGKNTPRDRGKNVNFL